MSTEVFWNDAKPPRSEGEHAAAGWLAMVARNVGLTSVTEDNRSEWLWRFAFTQEMRGRRFGGKQGYERDIGRLETVLDRFRTATMEGQADGLICRSRIFVPGVWPQRGSNCCSPLEV